VEGKNYLSALHAWKGKQGRGRLGRVGRVCPALPYLIQTRYIQPLLFSDSYAIIKVSTKK